MATTNWEIQNSLLPESQVHTLAAQLEISPLLVRLLNQRGLEDAQAMDHYLSPGLRHLPHWKDWPAVEPAAKLVCQLIEKNKKIAVWGDYDVDGISAASLLFLFFRERAGRNIVPVIPKRSWGYGLNSDEIENLRADGIQAIITVDCGINATTEIKRARELGMTTIITDHHTPAPPLPEANAILNPRITPSPAPQLAGVGVAFYLAAAVNNLLSGNKVDIRQYLDLVALGTIADLVPLDEQNRILVKNGLLLLQEARRPGIAALKQVCSLAQDAKVGTSEISFGLAPRLNAAGRIDDPKLAFQILVSGEKDESKKLARQLNILNEQRKELEETTCLEAQTQAETLQARQSLVLYNEHWDGGIIGITASKMVEKFYRPCLMLTREKDKIKGSGRSISQVDLYQALADCKEELEQFGGHRLAAGFTLDPGQLQSFSLAFDRAVRAQLQGKDPIRCLKIDAQLPFADINLPLIQELDLMQPFGSGNRKPIFQSQPVTIQAIRTFGKGKDKHIELRLQSTENKGMFKAIGWKLAEKWQNSLAKDTSYLIAFRPKLSVYKGLTSIDLQVEDIKKCP